MRLLGTEFMGGKGWQQEERVGRPRARSQNMCCAPLEGLILFHQRAQGCGIEDINQGKYSSAL